jgi:DNA repair exonuclease SbcCD ATPase subunit
VETKKHTDILTKIDSVEKELEKHRNSAQYEYDKANGNINKIEVTARSYKPKDNLKEINDKISELTKSLEEYPVNETVEESQHILDEYIKYISSHKEIHEKNINALTQEVNNLTVELRSNKSDILKYEDEIKRLASLTGTCPTCLHSLEGSDGEHINIHIDDLNKKIDKLKSINLESKIQECKYEISNQKVFINKLDDGRKLKEDEFKAKESNRRAVAKINSDINTYKTQISNDEARAKIYENYISQLNDEKESLKKSGEVLEKLKPIWKEFLNKKTNAKDNYNTFLQKLENNKKIGLNIKNYNLNIEQYKSRKFSKETEECRFITLKNNVNSEIEVLTKRICELDIELKAGEILKGVFSEEGAKTYITKKIIDILNRRISYYIQKYQFKIKIVLDEFFEDKIFNQKGEECSYFNFSGAERKSIDLAILFAFIDLRKIQGDVNINTLFFDEILDSSMDKTGIQITLDILKERVDNYGEAIYVISHRKESLSNFDGEIIELEKRNGITTRK